LLLHYLLRRGKYHVEIYERRPDPRLVDASKDRTFPISLQERGRRGIRAAAGLEEEISAQSMFCQGTIVVSRKGRSTDSPQKLILSIDRNRLVTVLLKQLTQQHSPDQVKVYFSCSCIQVDGTAKTVTLKPEEEIFTVSYDLLGSRWGTISYSRVFSPGSRLAVRTTHIGCL